jgi:hypothetical protein
MIDDFRRVFEKRLTTAFINAYKEPNMSLLADSLKGLASISLQTVAEQTFANEIVRPYMEKVCLILENRTRSTNLLREFTCSEKRSVSQ